MVKTKERATGTAVAAVCGFLTGSFVLSIALLQYLVGLEFVPGSLLAVAGYFVAGMVLVGVSTGVFMMRPASQQVGVVVYLATAAIFALMTLNTMESTSIALIGAVMVGSNVMAALSLVASEDDVVDGRTDTSDDHAVDIGTGFH